MHQKHNVLNIGLYIELCGVVSTGALANVELYCQGWKLWYWPADFKSPLRYKYNGLRAADTPFLTLNLKFCHQMWSDRLLSTRS